MGHRSSVGGNITLYYYCYFTAQYGAVLYMSDELLRLSDSCDDIDDCASCSTRDCCAKVPHVSHMHT